MAGRCQRPGDDASVRQPSRWGRRLSKLRQRAAGVTRDVAPNPTGLGTVRAFDAITAKIRLDGELRKLAFTEGQEVNAGDLLWPAALRSDALAPAGPAASADEAGLDPLLEQGARPEPLAIGVMQDLMDL